MTELGHINQEISQKRYFLNHWQRPVWKSVNTNVTFPLLVINGSKIVTIVTEMIS